MVALADTATLLLAAGAAAGAVGLAVLAAALLAHGAEERDLSRRMRSVLRQAEWSDAPRREQQLGKAVMRPFMRLGEALQRRAVISEKDLGEFQRALAAAGFNPQSAALAFTGAKAVLLLLLPIAAIGLAFMQGSSEMATGLMIAGALILAVLGPNWAIGFLRRPFQAKLRQGLPDALDLLVVAAEAGLGLESAVSRVAEEMARSNRAIAVELNTLVQELRMLPDRRTALERLAERTGLEGFKRLGTTLSQTLRYGTPLAQALRTLAAEMRTERMLRIEEKAIRLPALLIGPLILFILPSLFIALIGPSVLELGKTLGPSP